MDIVACCVMPKTQIHSPFKSDIQFNVILFLSDYVWGDLWKLLHRWHCYWWCSHYRWNLSRYNSNCYHLFSNASLFPFIGSISRWPSGSTENFKNVIKNSLSLSRQTHEKLTSICVKKCRLSCISVQRFLSSEFECVILLTFWY